MPGLHIPGIPTVPVDRAARFRSGPVFRTMPREVQFRTTGSRPFPPRLHPVSSKSPAGPHIPGIPTVPADPAGRIRSGPVFRTIPREVRFRATECRPSPLTSSSRPPPSSSVAVASRSVSSAVSFSSAGSSFVRSAIRSARSRVPQPKPVSSPLSSPPSLPPRSRIVRRSKPTPAPRVARPVTPLPLPSPSTPCVRRSRPSPPPAPKVVRHVSPSVISPCPSPSRTHSVARPKPVSTTACPVAPAQPVTSRLSSRRHAPSPAPAPRPVERRYGSLVKRSAPSAKPTGPRHQSPRSMLAPKPTAGRVRAQEALARIDAVLARHRQPPSGSRPCRKDTQRSDSQPAKKQVRFGNTQVKFVDKWIDPVVDVFQGFTATDAVTDPIRGWKVTPLKEPDADGEQEKYTTFHGGGSLIETHYDSDCGQSCTWFDLAMTEKRIRQRVGIPLDRIIGIPVDETWEEWNRDRAQRREDGRWAL